MEKGIGQRGPLHVKKIFYCHMLLFYFPSYVKIVQSYKSEQTLAAHKSVDDSHTHKK